MTEDRRFDQEVFEREIAEVPKVTDRLWLRGKDRAHVAARAREAALAQDLARARARSGDDSGDVQEAGRRFLAQRQDSDRRQLEIRAIEIGRQDIRAGHFAVMGRVLDPDGRPLAGLRVVVTDERGDGAGGSGTAPAAAGKKHGGKKPPRRPNLGEAVTDDDGFYLVQRPEREFRRFFARSSQLVVIVTGVEPAVRHVVVRPLGDDRQRIRIVDVRLPAEAFESSAAGEEGEAAGAETGAGEAPSQPELSELKGIGPRRLKRLEAAGIRDLSALAAMEPGELRRLLRVSDEVARALILQARSLLAGR